MAFCVENVPPTFSSLVKLVRTQEFWLMPPATTAPWAVAWHFDSAHIRGYIGELTPPAN